MSWQPMMYIPRATRMRGRTWLVAAFSPAVALLIAYLVTLLSLALGPSPEQLAQAAGEEIPPLSTVLPGLVDGVPNTAVSALILTLLGLAAPMSMTIKLVASLGFPLSFQLSVWIVPLTLTLVMALVIFLLHRKECRGISQSGLMVSLPALLSGAVFAVIAGVASLFTTLNMSVSPQLLSTLGEDFGLEASMSFDAVWLILGAFVLGFLSAALARLNAIRPRRTTYAYTSLPSHAHAFAHALRTSFTVLVGAALATGLYMAVYALLQLDGVPANILFYSLPFLINVGIACIFGAIGGLGVVTMDAPSDFGGGIPGGSENETMRALIFDGAPWTIWIMAIFVVSALVLGAVYWGRTRDPRTEHGVLSWLALPIAFSFAGFLAISLNMLVIGGSFFGEIISVTIRLSWLDLLWVIGIGILMEIISRFAGSRGPLSPEQLVPGIYQGLGQHGAGQQMPGPYPPNPGQAMPGGPMSGGPTPGQAPYHSSMPQAPMPQAPMPGPYPPMSQPPTQQFAAPGTAAAGSPPTAAPSGTTPPTSH